MPCLATLDETWEVPPDNYAAPTIQASHTSPKPPLVCDDPIAWLRGRIAEITDLVAA